MRVRVPALLAGMALAAAGCSSEPTAPDDHTAAIDAAQTLMHLADSLSANGGGASEVRAYRGLAALLQGTGRLSTVTISVDGTPAEFLATAQEISFGCPPEMLCSMIATPPDRLVSAWQKANPRQTVQLFVPGGGVPIVSNFAEDASIGAVPDLLFLDGRGTLYGGASASRSIDATVGDTPCVTRDDRRLAVYSTWPCRQADFTVAFDGVVDLIPLIPLMPLDTARLSAASSSATGAPSHRLTMAQQTVRGAHVDMQSSCAACGGAPGWPAFPPPMTSPQRDSLMASLSACGMRTTRWSGAGAQTRCSRR